jgi:hypothetical protein
MTKQLYEEALADVKKLKEVAEDNAKKALIEAVAPRIKDLIEAELLREADDEHETDNLLLDDEYEGSAAPSIAAAAVDLVGMSQPDVAQAISLPDEEGKVVFDLDALSVDPAAFEDDEFVVGVNQMHANENTSTPGEKINEASIVRFESKLFRISEGFEKMSRATGVVRETKTFKKLVSEMVSEVENLYQYLQESVGNIDDKELYENKLEKLYKDLNQLMEQKMNMKNKLTLNEEDLALTLKLPDDVEIDLDQVEVELAQDEEGPEEGGEEPEGDEGDEGGEELDLDVAPEGDEEEESPEGEEEEEKKEGAGVPMESRRLSDNTIVEIDEGMLRREISKMRALREAADDVQSWGHGAGDVSDGMDFEDDDLGDPLELDVTAESVEETWEAAGMEAEAMHDEGVDEDVDEVMQAVDQGGSNQDKEVKRQPKGGQPKEGVTAESLKRRLSSESRLQLEAKKKAKMAAKKHKDAKESAAKSAKEAKVDEAKAKMAAQKKQVKDAKKHKDEANRKLADSVKQTKVAAQMKEAYDFFAMKFNESVRRTTQLKTMLAEVSKRNGETLNGSSARLAEGSDNLRKKLAETNLFNMKLLYTNKLLQNESLTKRQKADVIERLDEAASEREVKLVYESLVKTLAAPQKSSLSEAAQTRVLGSSSAPTRPASTVLNEGFETDRWAKLAGIK